MTVDFTYQVCLFACSKNLQQGYLSPSDFNLIINQASKSYQDWLVGEFQQYQPGRPVPKVGYGQNENVRQSLTPTIYGYILNLDSTGFSPYPADYEKMDAMWTLYGYQRIRYTPQDQMYSLYNSRIDPYETNPFYMVEELGFRFFPRNLNQTRLSYIKTVPTIVWGYTLDGNGLPVYNPLSSTDPVWGDIDMLEVIARALRLIGVNLSSDNISQYANEVKQIGQ